MLAHNALSVACIHVAHLDTTGTVAATTAWATHKQLTGLFGLEQTLSTGCVIFRWDVAGHFTGDREKKYQYSVDNAEGDDVYKNEFGFYYTWL